MKTALIVISTVIITVLAYTLMSNLLVVNADNTVYVADTNTFTTSDESYEVIYMHLSGSRREELDQEFATLILNSNVSSKTVDEVVAIIQTFKDSVYSTYDFQYQQTRYGMGGMMGGYFNNYCSANRDSYEWYYFHLSEADQLLADQRLATELIAIDYTNLNVSDLVNQIQTIKTDLIPYLETLIN